MTTYGYARVSTNGQDLSSQEAELMAAGCAKVFKEKVSGAKTDRAELAKLRSHGLHLCKIFIAIPKSTIHCAPMRK